ncbi:hypothetical protein HDU96_004296, partial [Phlyctochytrium bullatum]
MFHLRPDDDRDEEIISLPTLESLQSFPLEIGENDDDNGVRDFTLLKKSPVAFKELLAEDEDFGPVLKFLKTGVLPEDVDDAKSVRK